MSKPSLFRRVFSAIWNGITRVRLALSNILFLLMLLIIYLVYLGGPAESIPEQAALLLNPVGSIVDQRSPVMPLQALGGGPSPADNEVLLRDVLDAIEFAGKDPAINSLVMELDQLVYVGLSKSMEIAAALASFRETGKPVVAIGDYFSQDQYLLASQADEIITHPLGGVVLEGFSSFRNYFRQALENVSVNVHVFRAGEHKSAMEPFMRDDMSPGEKEVTGRWLQVLWDQYTSAVESRRELPPGAINDYSNRFAERLEESGGNTAKLALEAGLVDQLLGRKEANDYLVEMVGASDDDGLYEAVTFERYVSRQRPSLLAQVEGARVAVITAQGDMLPGEQPPGTIGGDSLASLIKTTAEEEDVKAIVLRVNTGGGSMFAAEVVRQEVLRVRSAGKPVVVSMGSVAASGGYYIAADADEIWASPSTITGSIGVFAAFPTFEKLLQRAGVYTDGVGTTEMSGALRLDRPLNPQVVSALNSGVRHAYRSFLQIVADGRDMTVEEVLPLAEGRVWSAPDALENGLVDALGSLEDAIDAAAARADLDVFEVDFVELPLSPRELLLEQLSKRVGSLGSWAYPGVNATLSQFLRPVREATRELSILQDPAHLYMRCVSCAALQ